MLTATSFARVCANMGWELDECVKALVADYSMDEAEARELMNAELRTRQELDITDAHDDLEDEARDRRK